MTGCGVLGTMPGMTCKAVLPPILKGATFLWVLRWESAPPQYAAITNIAQGAPAVVTAPAHGIPDGWRVAIVSVAGMRQINAENDPPEDSDYHQAVVVDEDTVSFPDINAASFSAYKEGGYLRFNSPVPLDEYTARMSIKDKVGGAELMRLDTTNGRIVVDDMAKTITLQIAADDTAAIDWKQGVFDLEMESGTGVVTRLLSGTVCVSPEVTTD